MTPTPAGARPSPDGLHEWFAGPLVEDGHWRDLYCGPRDDPATYVARLPHWCPEVIAAAHNLEIDAARAARPTVGDVEAMLARVLAAALRELLTPRWWRRLHLNRMTGPRGQGGDR